MKVKTARWYTATPVDADTNIANYAESVRAGTSKDIRLQVEATKRVLKDDREYIVVMHKVQYYGDRTYAMMQRCANNGESWDIYFAISGSTNWGHVTLNTDAC